MYFLQHEIGSKLCSSPATFSFFVVIRINVCLQEWALTYFFLKTEETLACCPSSTNKNSSGVTNIVAKRKYLLGESLGEYHKIETIKTLNIYI